jgi:hypothetical protein
LGSIALIYSLINTGFTWVRDVEDELNAVASGDVTALLCDQQRVTKMLYEALFMVWNIVVLCSCHFYRTSSTLYVDPFLFSDH